MGFTMPDSDIQKIVRFLEKDMYVPGTMEAKGPGHLKTKTIKECVHIFADSPWESLLDNPNYCCVYAENTDNVLRMGMQ